jgi:membrane-bound serine protease (ClpP class)
VRASGAHGRVLAAPLAIPLAALWALAFACPATAAPPLVHVLSIDGAINPVASEYIREGIARAEEDGAAAVILELDTPGGLYKSTHVIAKTILAADVPFVTYVSPAGSTATSAGVFVTYAAHVAAMHPATSIGAASPVNLGGAPPDSVMSRKAENDAVAFIRSLAERHGRNADWAEKAVRRAVSATADSARALRVVDLVAPSLDSLLAALDGRSVRLERRTVTLATAGARIERAGMNWRFRVLDYVSDPNIAYVLFTLGMLGLLLELYNPGAVLPGVAGAICLILAFYGLHTLPLNYAGLLLILVAIILFILEVKVPSYGVLTIGGVIAMFMGSLMLVDIDPTLEADFLKIRLAVILPAVATTAAFFLFIVTKGILAQRQRPATGLPALIGARGVARSAIGPGRAGQVLVRGELWAAEASAPIAAGETVRVVSGSGLKLAVAPAGDAPPNGGAQRCE